MLQTQVLIVVAAVTLHNYIRQQKRRDWLLEKYRNDEMIVIDSNDGAEKDEALAGFMPSHLTCEMD